MNSKMNELKREVFENVYRKFREQKRFAISATPSSSELMWSTSFAIDRALCLEQLQERSRVIFGALSAQLFFLAPRVPRPDFTLGNKLREALQSLLPNFIITEDCRSLASLPTELGGMGICRLAQHADAHFLSSHLACTALARSHVPRVEHFLGKPFSGADVGTRRASCSLLPPFSGCLASHCGFGLFCAPVFGGLAVRLFILGPS